MIGLCAFTLRACPSSGITGIFFGRSLSLLDALRAKTISKTGRTAKVKFEIKPTAMLSHTNEILTASPDH
jgi:hypothetical protein